MNFVKCVALCALFQMFSFSSKAQIFGEEETASSLSSKAQDQATQVLEDETASNKSDNNSGVVSQEEQLPPNEVAPSEMQQNTNINLLTLNQTENNDQGIYVYYGKFKISHLFNGTTRCILNFVVYTTLPNKLSNISFRLQWPENSTQLSFDSVMPGKEYSVAQSFYGNGCYSMDKLPNITVNRCRLKGMDQRACAALVRLTTEDQAPFRK